MSDLRFSTLAFVSLALALLGGCPGAEAPADAGLDAASTDAGRDGGSSDATSSDAASSDARIDGGSDAATVTLDDAGSDAGSDAGRDAAIDAGTDAGPTEHSCMITVSPASAPVSMGFTFTAESDGESCTASLDGGTPLVVGCNSRMEIPGSVLGIGAHSVELAVAGPLGPTSCVTGFTVTEDTSTTCSITIVPESGPPSTEFTATYASNGAGCTLMVDDFDLGPTECNDVFVGEGTLIGPGTHTGTLVVGSGPGGATSCSDTFTVTP